MNAKPRGRQFFPNPGPTNIPDRVLRAMDRAVLDFLSDEFMAIHRTCHAGVKRVLKTQQHLYMYAASGHGAWEAALANIFSPGDRVLMLESGYFSDSWTRMAGHLGLEVETDAGTAPFDPGLGLPTDFAAQVVGQVGNYAEIYDRNVGPGTPLGLERGVNALWTDGGLHYAPPYR